MTRKPQKMSPAQRAWLTELLSGPAIPHGKSPYACRKRGWAEMEVQRGSVRAGVGSVKARFPNGYIAAGWSFTNRDRITHEGRTALAAMEGEEG